MAIPVITITLDAGAVSSSDSDIAVTLTGTNSPVYYSLSLDATHWSEFVWATSTTVDLESEDIGGEPTAGLRYVYARARNGDGTSEISSDSIYYQPATPRILLSTPVQRTGTNLVDIVYAGLDKYSRQVVTQAEYLYLGTWYNCSPSANDSYHSGTLVLYGTSITYDKYFVWDLEADLGTEFASSVIQVRLRAIYGATISSYTTSGTFSVDTTSEAVDIDLPLVKPGSLAYIKTILIDESGDLYDPEWIYLQGILNPSLIEQLSNVVSMDKETTGIYSTYHSLADDAETGLWRYIIQSSWHGRNTESVQYFTCIEVADIEHYDRPSSGCVITGILQDVSGQPLASETIKFISYDADDDLYGGQISATTNSYGRFELEISRGETGYIVIEELSYTKFITIPDTHQKDYLSL